MAPLAGPMERTGTEGRGGTACAIARPDQPFVVAGSTAGFLIGRRKAHPTQ
jgi:hypothetical protein